MPPASHGFIIESMLPESSICLMLLFKGILSTCISRSSEILTLHVVHTLSFSHNHMILQSYYAPQSYFPHWQETLNPIVDISSLVVDQVVSLVFDGNKSIHTLGFMQCLGFHQTILVVSSPMSAFFIISYQSKGLSHVQNSSGACERCTWSLVHEHPIHLNSS